MSDPVPDAGGVAAALFAPNLADRLQRLSDDEVFVVDSPPLAPGPHWPVEAMLPLADGAMGGNWQRRNQLAGRGRALDGLRLAASDELARELTVSLVRWQVRHTIVHPADELPPRFGPLAFQGCAAACQAVHTVVAAFRERPGGEWQGLTTCLDGADVPVHPGDLAALHLLCEGLETWRRWLRWRYEMAFADLAEARARWRWLGEWSLRRHTRRTRRLGAALAQLDAVCRSWCCVSPLDAWDQGQGPIPWGEVLREPGCDGMRFLLAEEAAHRPTSAGAQRLFGEVNWEAGLAEHTALFLAALFGHLARSSPPLDGVEPDTLVARISASQAVYRGLFDHWERLKELAADAPQHLKKELNDLRTALHRQETWKNAPVRTAWEKLDAALEHSRTEVEVRTEVVAPAAPADTATTETDSSYDPSTDPTYY
jgi:hypothetical protein